MEEENITPSWGYRMRSRHWVNSGSRLVGRVCVHLVAVKSAVRLRSDVIMFVGVSELILIIGSGEYFILDVVILA